MPAFIDYVHNYRKVDEHSGSISIWSFVVMIFGQCVLILILIFRKYILVRGKLTVVVLRML